jgi:NAD(P)H-dependent flavin oxidoreductase YrpB (nitropropane dioxygenase family)
MERKPLIIGDKIAEVPVIQGGMGVGISLSGLAGAVAACGGVGVISTAQIGYREASFDRSPLETNLKALNAEIKKARELAGGRGILAVNIMSATKSYESYVKAALEADIDLIISGAGIPDKLPALTKGTRTKIAPIVSTAKSASVILRLWERKYTRVPDLVVIEGPKAGGHLGFTREQLEYYTEERYREEILAILAVVKGYEKKHNVHIPVAVAGGIYDRKDMDEALSLGADAVQMGTRFVTTYECDASEAYKEAYIRCRKEEIRIVDSPVGLPGRAIANPFILKEKEKGVHGRCWQCLKKM